MGPLLPQLPDALSAKAANDYGEGMPADDASTGGQLHDLYAQAAAAREKAQLLTEQLLSTERKAQENWQLIRDSWDRTEMIQANRRAARTDPDRLRYSAHARLQARLASMPVIEQAKGIIMARQGWSEDQAFDALRRASQRENVKVRDLAASIVARAARPAPSRPPSGSASATARSDDERSRRTGSGSYRASA
jgi:ANTAR domain-containing protein